MKPILLTTVLWAIPAASGGAQSVPPFLVSHGGTLYRVSNGAVETFEGMGFSIIGMTIVPGGVELPGISPRDVIAIQGNNGPRVWRVDNARTGTPALVEIGRFPLDHGRGDITFAHGRLFGVQQDTIYEYSTADFSLLQSIELNQPEASSGGLAFDGQSHWYISDQNHEVVARLDDPPSAESWDNLGPSGVAFGNNDLECFRGRIWLAARSGTRLVLYAVDEVTGGFSQVFAIEGITGSAGVGLAFLGPYCTADYNNSGDYGDILDFLDFFEDFGTCQGHPAPCGTLGNPDVNGDTIIDILDFLDFLDAFGQGC